jgi:hypothetical protein
MKRFLTSILLVTLLIGFGSKDVRAYSTNSLNSLSNFLMPADTIKPRVNTLGIDSINVPCKNEFIDSPISLEDNVNTDMEMRPFLAVGNSLPINANGKPFCFEAGFFKAFYIVRDLSSNVSDTSIRIINCMCSPAGLIQNNLEQIIGLRFDPNNKLLFVILSSSSSEEIEAKVLDIYGKEVYSNNYKDEGLKEMEIPLNEAAAGVYLVKVQIGNSSFVKKILLN